MGWLGSLIGGGLGLGAGYLAKKKQNKAAEQAQGILQQNQQVLGMMAQFQSQEILQQNQQTAQNISLIGSNMFDVQKKILSKLGPAMNPNKLPGLGVGTATTPFTNTKKQPMTGSGSVGLGGY